MSNSPDAVFPPEYLVLPLMHEVESSAASAIGWRSSPFDSSYLYVRYWSERIYVYKLPLAGDAEHHVCAMLKPGASIGGYLNQHIKRRGYPSMEITAEVLAYQKVDALLRPDAPLASKLGLMTEPLDWL